MKRLSPFLVALLANVARGQEPTALIVVEKGDLPIILTAPHGGRTKIDGIAERTGAGVKQFTTARDDNTLELTRKLADLLAKKMGARPHLVLARFERKQIDANRAPQDAFESKKAEPFYSAYHDAIRAACADVRKDWGHGALFDIHGQGIEKDGIFRGTRNGETTKDLEARAGKAAIVGPKSVYGQMARHGWKIFPPLDSKERETKLNGGHTVAAYGSGAGTRIDAIQLELGGDLRAKKDLDRTAVQLAGAIEVFAREYLPAKKK